MSERLLSDQARNAMAIISSVAAFGGGIALSESLSTSSASADSPTVTSTSPGTTETAPSPNDQNTDPCNPAGYQPPAGPYIACWDHSSNSNRQVKDCQDNVTGKYNQNYDMIAWRHLDHKKHSSHLVMKEGLRRFQQWVGNGFEYACAEVTRNYVKEQLVKRDKHHHIEYLGKAVKVRGDDSIAFDGVQYKTVATSTPFKLPKQARQSHTQEVYGITDVIMSVPLKQKPYYDPNNPSQNVPGPMHTQHSKAHTVWLKVNR